MLLQIKNLTDFILFFRSRHNRWNQQTCSCQHHNCFSLARKIARHEIPDWCPNTASLYPHCVGQATTLDVGCYPPPAGAVTGAPGQDCGRQDKRQTVVDRLKRRLEVYRRHQGSCLPRYDQAANGLYDAQRQETLLLKQRFLEAKAKKSRRNDHHSRNTTSSEQGQRNSTVVCLIFFLQIKRNKYIFNTWQNSFVSLKSLLFSRLLIHI